MPVPICEVPDPVPQIHKEHIQPTWFSLYAKHHRAPMVSKNLKTHQLHGLSKVWLKTTTNNYFMKWVQHFKNTIVSRKEWDHGDLWPPRLTKVNAWTRVHVLNGRKLTSRMGWMCGRKQYWHAVFFIEKTFWTWTSEGKYSKYTQAHTKKN